MMVDIIITHRGAPGFSASAVRNPLVKAEPSTQNEAAPPPKTVFSQVFGAGAKTHFQNLKVPPGWGSSDGGAARVYLELGRRLAYAHADRIRDRRPAKSFTFTLGPSRPARTRRPSAWLSNNEDALSPG